jgi:hypothetical protein
MPSPLNATTENPVVIVASNPKPSESEAAKVLLLRLDEIKAMDKSTLSASERKKLRKETRSIKSQLREIKGGVYISAGTLIIIAIILILLL